MYGIFTYTYHTNQPNVGKYTIHGCYGIEGLHLRETNGFFHKAGGEAWPGGDRDPRERSRSLRRGMTGTRIATFAVVTVEELLRLVEVDFVEKSQPVSEEKNHPPGKPVATFISSNWKPLNPSNPVALKNGTLGFPGTSIFGWGSGLFL